MDIAIVIAYFVIVLYFGTFKTGKINNIRDYAVSKGRFSTAVLVAGLFAAWVSGGMTIGFIEKIHTVGLIISFSMFGAVIQSLLLSEFIIKKLEPYQNCISVGEIIEKIYGKYARIISGVLGAIVSIGYIGGQIAAISYTLEFVFGFTKIQSVYISYLAVVLYSTSGGIRAVTITDAIQFILIIIVIPLLFNVGIAEIGSFKKLFDAVPKEKLNFFEISYGDYSYFYLFLMLAAPMLAPLDVQRILMNKNLEQAKRNFRWTALILVMLIIIISFIGLQTLVIMPDVSAKVIIPKLITEYIPTGMKGLTVAGMLAIIMSTASAHLNAASICLVHDIITPIRPYPHSGKQELIMARAGTFLIGLFSIVAATRRDNIIEISAMALNFWVPIITIPLVSGLMGLKVSRLSFYLSTGLSSAVILCFLLLKDYELDPKTAAFAALINIVTFFGIYFYEKRSIKPLLNFFKMICAFIISKVRNFFFQLKLSLKAIAKSDFSLVKIASDRVQDFGAQYFTFGCFGLINYVVPYFMWSGSSLIGIDVAIYSRLLGGILAGSILFYEIWPETYKKYLPLYWYFVLMYCLPFTSTFMLLDNDFSVEWLINQGLAILLLAVLVDWLMFIVISGVGSFIGYVLFALLHESSVHFHASAFDLNLVVYGYTFIAVIGAVFSRNKQFIHQKVVELLNDKVKERTAHLREALEIKKRFLNNISHEVRTPLQGIIAISSELGSRWDAFPEEYKKRYVSIISNSGNRLMELMNNILDLSKMQAKQMVLKKEKIDLVQLIKLSIEHNQGFLFANLHKDLKINFEVPDFEEAYVKADREMILRVLNNFMSNAIKYSEGGDIVVSIEKNANKSFMVKVKDSGVGIPENELRSIFDPFIESSRTRTKAGGKGLGLALCKEIIDAHNGEIWAENNKNNQGASFYFTVPK